MPVDRKALIQKMRDEQNKGARAAKAILYPMPDLRGPGGNAFALIGQAGSLMKEAGLPDTLFDAFSKEAMSGDYDKVLDTIQTWFTVVIRSSEFHPIGDIDIKSLKPGEDGELSWEDVDPETVPEELSEALEDYAAKADEDRRVADIQQRVNEQIRKELGLGPDEVVIVQIKKTGKKV